jgi:hypothetical protein
MRISSVTGRAVTFIALTTLAGCAGSQLAPTPNAPISIGAGPGAMPMETILDGVLGGEQNGEKAA